MPDEINSAIVILTIKSECVTQCMFTQLIVCNVISVLVELVNFAMVKVDNFCQKKLVAVYFKACDRKNARIVVSKSERQTNLSTWIFNDIVIVMSKEIVF